jgi:hypothetical protein
MIKILDAENWLDEVGENTKEINKCLKEGLIRYFYGANDLYPRFVVLDSNLQKVKAILKDDYNKLRVYTTLEYVKNYTLIDEMTMRVNTLFGDEFELSSDTILDLLSDEFDLYISKESLLGIYNAEIPINELDNVINEAGRRQAIFQIEALLNEIKNQKFE